MINSTALFILCALAALVSSHPAGAQGSQSCNTNCGSVHDVEVNLVGKCMCLKTGSGSNCFKISIGTNGPRQTDGGIGKITGDVRGARYQTKSSASASYDNDALKMGIPGNDKLGKWIHKTRNCSSGGTNSTLGCVAVPCDKWPEFKQFAVGKSLKVCGGGNMSNGYGRSSGRSDTSVDGASGSSR